MVSYKEKRYKACIFDMDGLLLDTERIAYDVFTEIADAYGVNPHIEDYSQCIGANKTYREKILKEFFPSLPLDQFIPAWEKEYKNRLLNGDIPIKKGVMELLSLLKSKQIHIAVATSTHRELAYLKLEKTNLVDFFHYIIGGDQIEKSKPDPEIYLRVKEEFGVDASECLVFEDSTNGVISAYKAEMDVIQVIDLIEATDLTVDYSLDIHPSFHRVLEKLN